MLNLLITCIVVSCITIITFLILSYFSIINDWYADEIKPKRLFWSTWTASLMVSIGTQIIAIATVLSVGGMAQYTFYAFLPLIITAIIIGGFISFVMIHMTIVKKICARNE